ncbi:MAG: TolC family protein [Pirellulaceae bacterium]
MAMRTLLILLACCTILPGCRGRWQAVQPHHPTAQTPVIVATAKPKADVGKFELTPKVDPYYAGTKIAADAEGSTDSPLLPASFQSHDKGLGKTTDAKAPGDSNAPPQAILVAASNQLANTQSSSASDLTLEQLEATALAANPSLAEQRALIESLRGKWLQAGLRPNPYAGFSGQQLFSGGEVEQIGIVAGQKIVRSEKIAWDQTVVCREIEVASQKLAAQQQRVLTDTRISFYQVLIAQRRADVTRELETIAAESFTKTKSLLENGLGTQIDVLRSSVELQTAKLELQNAETKLNAAWKQLTAVIGQPQMPQQKLAGELEPTEIAEDVNSIRERLLAESPEIAAALSEQEHAHAQLQRAMVEPLGDIDVQSVVQHDNGTGGTNANLQVTIPIPRRNRNQGGIQEARMQLVAAQLSQQRVELSLQSRLAATQQLYESAFAQVKGFSAAEGVLANSRKTLELIRKAYDAGEIGSLDLISAQKIFSQTSLQYLDALETYWAAKLELDGLLLKDSLAN